MAFLASATAGPPAIRWVTDPLPGAVEVTGISRETLPTIERHRQSEGGNALLAVYAEPVAGVVTRETTMPPIAGSWRAAPDRLRFEPQFPWTHGVRYRAEYRPPGGAMVVSFFELPEVKPATPTEVLQVFPSAAVLPENQLKFYVQFSAPMSRGGTYEHVHIRDAHGRVIDLPFLELDEELWDPGMTRLTLLIDPGRIKRGVKPLEDIGPVFEAGNSYSLTLDPTCRDAAGHPLRGAYEKKFRIGPADRTPPDPRRWKIAAPRPNTREPLVVEFGEPMDQALALRLIRVIAPGARTTLWGDAALAQDEQEWRFTPSKPWSAGIHRLTVATTIEDLAGNNIGKTFDVELVEGAKRRVAAENVEVSFEVL